MVRKHIFFSGDVQGVGFRYRSFYIAQSLGLTGWVENLWDGRWINVTNMEITEIPCEEERGFKIR